MYKPIKPSDIPSRQAGAIGALAEQDLKDFALDSYRAVEVEIPAGRKPANVCTAYRKARARLGLDIEVFTVRGRVFMTKEKRAAPGAATPKGSKDNRTTNYHNKE